MTRLIFSSLLALAVVAGGSHADAVDEIVSILTGLPACGLFPKGGRMAGENVAFGTNFENILTESAQGSRVAEIMGRKIWARLRSSGYRCDLACGITSMRLSLKGYYSSSSTLSDMSGVFGSLSLSLSRGNVSAHLLGDFLSRRGSATLKIERYGHSADPEENIYFYDLLERAFGSSIPYSLANGKGSGAVLLSYNSNVGRFGLQFSRSDISLDMEMRYECSVDEDLRGVKYVLADLTLSPTDLRFFYSPKGRGLTYTFWGGAFLRKGNFNIDPLNPKRKRDIYLDVTHLGDGKLKIEGANLGIYISCSLPFGGDLKGTFGLAKGKLGSSASVSTPVLGRGLSSLFIPIVHRAKGRVTGSALSQLYGLSLRKSLGSSLKFEGSARLIYSTIRLKGRADYDFYGIEVSSWSEDAVYRSGKLITIGSTILYRVRPDSEISLGISQHIPIKPRRSVKGPPRPPKPRRIRKKAKGGLSLRLGLRYYL